MEDVKMPTETKVAPKNNNPKNDPKKPPESIFPTGNPNW